MANQMCLAYGHRLGRPKYFGQDEQFYVRHCQRCEHVAAGEIVVSSDGKSITIVKKPNKPQYDNAIISNQQKQVDNSTNDSGVKDGM